MNYESIGSNAENASRARLAAGDVSARLHDAVHALAQPLTALAFILELGRVQKNPDGCSSALDDASAECKRAFCALEQVREAVRALDAAGGWRQ